MTNAYDTPEHVQDLNLPFDSPVGAGNAIILGLTYQATATLTITDDGNNTWPDAAVSCNDSTATTTHAIYVLPNAASGTTTITIHSTVGGVDAAIDYVQAVYAEFYNVATWSPVDVSTSNCGAWNKEPNVTAGSMTTTVSGDLIWHYVVTPVSIQFNGGASELTAITPGSGFTLQTADWSFNVAAQYEVQSSAGEINPSITLTGGTQEVASLAVAIKSAEAGTPPGNGIRIVHMQHTRNSLNNNPWNTGFPATGNLIVAAIPGGGTADVPTTVADSQGNNYVIAEGTNQMQTRFLYAANATTGTDLSMTFAMAAPANRGGIIYDIVNAATSPLDTVTDASQSVDPDAFHEDAPDLTPSTSNGLVIAQVAYGAGPPSSVGGTNHRLLSIFFTGQTDASGGMDSGDGHQVFYNPDASAIDFSWQLANGGQTSWNTGANSEAIAFIAAPVAASIPSWLRNAKRRSGVSAGRRPF
jgi:hypothetical protein